MLVSEEAPLFAGFVATTVDCVSAGSGGGVAIVDAVSSAKAPAGQRPTRMGLVMLIISISAVSLCSTICCMPAPGMMKAERRSGDLQTALPGPSMLVPASMI